MSLIVAIQMDPLEAVDIDVDTSFALALEAHQRGYQLFIYEAADLSLEDGRVRAKGRWVRGLTRDHGAHVTWAGPLCEADLHEVDVVLIRQDPPFNMAYISAAHILERLEPATRVINAPAEIRNAPEKLFVTDFPSLTPATLITRDRAAIEAFRKKHEDIILKPLYGNGGAGIFRVAPHDQNFSSLIEMFQTHYPEPLIAQAYLPAVRAGDKRVILLDGVPVGALNRIPAVDEVRSNLHVGGRAEAIELTAKDLEICDVIGPVLAERGLFFVGIDIIGDHLTEINVTSPTGIQEIRRFGGADIAALHWDRLAERTP